MPDSKLHHPQDSEQVIARIRSGQAAAWLRTKPSRFSAIEEANVDVDGAILRFARFAPILAKLFEQHDWDGQVRSQLLEYPCPANAGRLLLKCDHALPVTGSIKARGGIHELLVLVERLAEEQGITEITNDDLRAGPLQDRIENYGVCAASTGNLGYSIGLVGRAFGFQVEVHMSRDAKAWKKERLRAVGAKVIEHDCDYGETVTKARQAAQRPDWHFVDDERSLELFSGYSAGARELAAQITTAGIAVTREQPLVVYLPCGVGGAPGGLTYGLKQIFGDHVIAVWVQPSVTAGLVLAMIDGSDRPPSIYDYGLSGKTIGDGMAVPRISELTLQTVGPAIDAAVAVTEQDMRDAVSEIWHIMAQRVEPSGAAPLAAYKYVLKQEMEPEGWPALRDATHVLWATGGAQLPDAEFLPFIGPH